MMCILCGNKGKNSFEVAGKKRICLQCGFITEPKATNPDGDDTAA